MQICPHLYHPSTQIHVRHAFVSERVAGSITERRNRTCDTKTRALQMENVMATVSTFQLLLLSAGS